MTTDSALRRTLLSIVALGILVGCQPAETATQDAEHGHSHDHADGPKSFEEGVAQLKAIQIQVNQAMENDDPDAAHDPLHDVGHLLNRLPELAADTDLEESDWNEVKADVDRLFEAFGDVDSAFHADGDKLAAYESSKSAIDEGVAGLVAKLDQLGIELPSLDHEHPDGDDHPADHEHDHSDEHEHDDSDDHTADHEHDHSNE